MSRPEWVTPLARADLSATQPMEPTQQTEQEPVPVLLESTARIRADPLPAHAANLNTCK